MDAAIVLYPVTRADGLKAWVISSVTNNNNNEYVLDAPLDCSANRRWKEVSPSVSNHTSTELQGDPKTSEWNYPLSSVERAFSTKCHGFFGRRRRER